MLYYLSLLEQYDPVSFLRIFKYVTFRAGGAAFTAFLIVLLFGPLTVRLLKRFRATVPGRIGEYDQRLADELKNKTPSMGGLLILVGLVGAILLWALPTNPLAQIFLYLILALGAIGFYDDWRKVRGQSSKEGMSGNAKIVAQIVVAGIAATWLYRVTPSDGFFRDLMVPFFKAPLLESLPLWVALGFAALVVVGSSNAVNLSDGLDGLAAGCTLICALTYAVFAYLCGHKIFADYLQVPFVPGSSEVVVIATAMAGAVLGFLWHNCTPAAMYMGDTGSLSLGGAVGLIAVLVKQELLLLIVGGIFVVEAGSVILQVGYYKLTRKVSGEPKRLFLRAPFHHHLQLKGWKETQIVTRFWIIGLLLAGFGLATLKIR